MNTNEESPLVIDVHLTRGLVLVLTAVLLVITMVGYIFLSRVDASASYQMDSDEAAASAGLRQYYLTPDQIYNGAEATGACVEGYHMASLWEINDPSNLRYNSNEGLNLGDSGSGPPDALGFLRTGFDGGDSSNNIPGNDNCLGWTSASETKYGTIAHLAEDWGNPAALSAIWVADTIGCNTTNYVWCVED